jgi:hypothetical protein
MPLFGELSVWVVTPTRVPFAATDPVMVTEIPVADTWFATPPPLLIVSELEPTAIVPAGFATLSEKVLELGLLFVSPR